MKRDIYMKKVLIMGLFDNFNNYGDEIIGTCVEWLINENCKNVVTSKYSFIQPYDSVLKKIICKFLNKLLKIIPNENVKGKVRYLSIFFRTRKQFIKQISKNDAVIFAAGSFKYGTQDLWAYYSIVIDICNKLNKPVMFDAMNIQIYDNTNWKCLFLRSHLNKKCVKIITTRDGEFGVQRLKNDYVRRSDMIIKAVGDPAMWADKVYNITKESDSKLLGINLIRPNIFEDYNDEIEEKTLGEFYNRLVRFLHNNKYQFEIFTNGLENDLDMINYIDEDLRRLYTPVVPKSSLDFMTILSRYKVVFAARLHACICSYSMDIPIYSFVWDEKMIGFATEIEKKEVFFLPKNLLQIDYHRLIELYEYAGSIKDMWKNATKDTIVFFVNNCVDSANR